MTYCGLESLSKHISFTVPGEPGAKGRHKTRAFIAKGRAFSQQYADKKTYAYENLIKLCFTEAFPEHKLLDEPIGLQITAYFPRPKAHFGTGKNSKMQKSNAPRFYTGRKDWDNIGKVISDALNQIAYRDDKLITFGSVFRRYDNENRPRTEVTIVYNLGEFELREKEER